MSRYKDISGQRFGRLVALYPTEKRVQNSVVWMCQCDCGNQKEISLHRLRQGTQSCGCLQKETTSKRMSKDITGQRFGKLVAIEPTEKRQHGSKVWKCQCDCGNIHYTYTEMLTSGKCQSCGCIRSRGNQKLKEILQSSNYLYISEYPIRVNEINYYFDFAILNKDQTIKLFIEYDGILHFPQDTSHGWNNKESWNKTQKNDMIKNWWCEENKIPLLRIPYTDFDDLNLSYLERKIGELCIMDQ